MTIILALMVCLMLLPLTLGLMTLGTVETQISSNLLKGKAAEYTAESGVEYGMVQLIGGASLLDTDFALPGQGVAHITVSPGDTDHERVIVSTATHAGAVRMVRAVAWREDEADTWKLKAWRME